MCTASKCKVTFIKEKCCKGQELIHVNVIFNLSFESFWGR